MNNKLDMHRIKTNAINKNDSQKLQEVNAKNYARGTTSSFLHINTPNIEDDIAYDENGNPIQEDAPIGAVNPNQEVTNPNYGARNNLPKKDQLKQKPTAVDQAKTVAKKKAGGAAISYATGGVIHGKLAEEIGGKVVDVALEQYKKKIKRKLILYGIGFGVSALIIIGVIGMFSEGETNRNPSNIAICSLADTNNKELKEYLYTNGYCMEENCQVESVDDEGKPTGSFEDQASYTFFKNFRQLLREKEQEFEPLGGFDSPLLYETIGYYRGDDELFQLSYHKEWFWWLEDFLSDQNKDADGNVIDPDIANMTATDKEMGLLSNYMYEWVKSDDVRLKDIFYNLITLIKDKTVEKQNLFLVLQKIFAGLDLIDTLTEKNFEDWWNNHAITYETYMLLDQFDRHSGSNLGADWLRIFGFKKVFSMNRYVGYLKYGKNLKQVADKSQWPTAESLKYTTETTYTGNIKEGYLYNRLKGSMASLKNNDSGIEELINQAIKQIYLNIKTFYGCTKAICKPCKTENGPGGACSEGFSMTNTTLSRDEFIEKVQQYAVGKSGGIVTLANEAGMIYDTALSMGVNPELVIMRAKVEGFSPGGSSNNFWGIGCTNTGGSKACRNYSTLKEGVEAFCNNVSKYSTPVEWLKKYAYIGAYWYNPGSSSLGGCYYFPYIKKYMSDGMRVSQISDSCAAGKTCSGSECLKTTDEDQEAYTKYQVSKMSDVRKDIFGLSSDECSNSGEIIRDGDSVTIVTNFYTQSSNDQKTSFGGLSNLNVTRNCCSITSMTMVISSLGNFNKINSAVGTPTLSEKWTVPIANSLAKITQVVQVAAYNGSSSCYADWGKMSSAGGVRQIKSYSRGGNDYAQSMVDELQAGHLLIIHISSSDCPSSANACEGLGGTSSGHFEVIYGYNADTKKFLVHNPGTYKGEAQTISASLAAKKIDRYTAYGK